MDTQKNSHLQNLLAEWPLHTVATNSWLQEQGISRFLKQRYLKSGWVKSIGSGAVIRSHDKVDWPGALWTLQTQLGLPIHIGAKTAISLQGRSQYLQFGKEQLFLFLPKHVNLPKWFSEGPWTGALNITKTTFLDFSLGLNTYTFSELPLKMSSLERAALELLYLAPKESSYGEINLIFENLTLLRPEVVEELLIKCKSDRVRRLFLYLGEKQKHSWFFQLNLSKIPLGTSILQVVPGGVYIKKYKMSIPKEWEGEGDDGSSLF